MTSQRKQERVHELKKQLKAASELAGIYYNDLSNARAEIKRLKSARNIALGCVDDALDELKKVRKELDLSRKTIKKLEHENSKLLIASIMQFVKENSKTSKTKMATPPEGITLFQWTDEN